MTNKEKLNCLTNLCTQFTELYGSNGIGLVGVGENQIQVEVKTFKEIFEGQPYQVEARKCEKYPYMLTIRHEDIKFVALI